MVRSQDSTGSLKLRLVHAQLKWWPLIAIHETRKFFFCSAFWLCWQLFLIRRPQSRIITAFTWPDQVIVKWLSTSNVALSHRYVCTQPWQGGIWLILGVNSSVLEFAKVPCERLVLPHPQSLDYSRVGNHVCVIYVVFFLEYYYTIILSINRKYSHAAILMQSQVKKNRLPTNTASSKKTQKLLNKNMSIYSIINTHLHSITQM